MMLSCGILHLSTMQALHGWQLSCSTTQNDPCATKEAMQGGCALQCDASWPCKAAVLVLVLD
jgi:hypothetical protein